MKFLSLAFMLELGTMDFKKIKVYTLVTNVLSLLECRELDNLGLSRVSIL